jgi:hypothetical protein
VKYLVELKQNKISLDFCLAHALLCIGVRESSKIDLFSAIEKKNVFYNAILFSLPKKYQKV